MKTTLRLYGELLRPFRWRVVAVVVIGAVAGVIEGSALLLLVPLINLATGTSAATDSLSVRVVDEVFSWVGMTPTVRAVLLVFASLGLVAAVLNHLALAQAHRLVADSEDRMRQQLFHAVTRMRWVAYSQRRSGSLIQSVYGDAQQTGLGVLNLFLSMTALLTAGAYFVLAMLLAWHFTLGAIVLGLLLAPVYVHYSRRGEALGRRTNELSEQLLNETTELLGNAKAVFSQGLRGAVRSYFTEIADAYRVAFFRQQIQSERLRVAWEVVAVAFVTAFLYLFLIVDDGAVSVALVWVGAFYRLAPRAVAVQMHLVRAVSFGSWLVNWSKQLAEAEAVAEPDGGDDAPGLDRSISLRGVSFSYPGADAPVLDGVDLEMAHGEVVALVGPSGHGKTTLLDIMSGLVRPDAGEVVVDGVALTPELLAAWQRRLGLVLQESPMLHRSIAENIRFGTDEADPGRLDEALRGAAAEDFVAGFPDGADTVVGERGGRLSGGQRQRLAFARALYRAPSLLLLDEATSALDPVSQRAVADTVAGLKGRVTVVLVSHGGPLLAAADRYYWVEGGSVRQLDGDESRDLHQSTG